MSDINWLKPITGLTTQELSTLFQSLQGDKDLNSARKSLTQAETELALVQKKSQEAHVDALIKKVIIFT